MDWKNITDSLSPYIAKMDPYLDMAKGYGKKAAEFAEEQIQTTPLFIRSQAEYDALITEKRVIIITYDETDLVADDIRLLSPIWLTRAFMDTARLRYISLIESRDLIGSLGLTSPIDMRVRFAWEETAHFTDISDIKAWWQNPTYIKTEPKEQIISDPLAGK
jgi:hypothetical protein